MNNSQAFPNPHRTDQTGMSLREYAAIKLKVPESGTDWLDNMILQSLKDEFAAKAMQALLSDPDWRHDADFEDTAYAAYMMTDAMLEAREA